MNQPNPKDFSWNPYFSGVILGIILFLSFFITGHGLGASGALARFVTATLKGFRPAQVDTRSFFAALGGGSRSTLSHWLVWEVIGVLLGGFISGLLAKRVKWETFHGPQISPQARAIFAVIGGLLVGWGTQLSRGCTSGQALSGGAVLSVGSWAFMFAVFGGAYVVAYPFRKLWR
jgi:uncharacterized membrane protein YedE/YeeE